MLWHKERISLTVAAGTIAGNTGKLKGVVEQFIVTPQDSNGVTVDGAKWDLEITDKDGDVVECYDNIVGRYDNRVRLPVGTDTSEKFKLKFSGVTSTTTINIIIKVLETTQ